MAHHKHHGHHRASGGAAEETRMAELREDEKEGRESEKYTPPGKVEKEAEADGYGGHKRGGRAHHHHRAAGGAVQALRRGGKVHKGSMPMHVDGHPPRPHRMGRPGRKR